MNNTARQVRLFSVVHYVFGVLNVFVSCLPAYFVVFGLQMIPFGREAQFAQGTPAFVDEVWRVFPYLFIAFGTAAMIGGLIAGLAMLLVGYCLARRAHYTLCHIALLPEALQIPAGTALALFTIITIRDPQVRAEFKRQ